MDNIDNIEKTSVETSTGNKESDAKKKELRDKLVDAAYYWILTFGAGLYCSYLATGAVTFELIYPLTATVLATGDVVKTSLKWIRTILIIAILPFFGATSHYKVSVVNFTFMIYLSILSILSIIFTIMNIYDVFYKKEK